MNFRLWERLTRSSGDHWIMPEERLKYYTLSDKLNLSKHISLMVSLVQTPEPAYWEAFQTWAVFVFPQLVNVLHRNLGLSFKKLGRTNIKKVRPESQSNLVKWLELLISLHNDQYYLIFIDEFTVNRQTQWTYGWTQKGKPGRMLIRAIDFKMSFIIAHSKWKLKVSLGPSQHSIKRNTNTFLVSSFQIWNWMNDWIGQRYSSLQKTKCFIKQIWSNSFSLKQNSDDSSSIPTRRSWMLERNWSISSKARWRWW